MKQPIDHGPLYSSGAAQFSYRRAGGAGSPRSDLLSLAYGRPDPGSFPAVDLIEVTQVVLSTQTATALQYGEVQGYRPLREAVAAGVTQSVARRQGLVELAAANGVALLEDDASRRSWGCASCRRPQGARGTQA